jgi:hypothetical protein
MATPFGPHAASPAELKEQLAAERRGERYLLYRDSAGAQRIVPLPDVLRHCTIGRVPSCDICLSWDDRVSRVHAELEQLGQNWAITDDGLSRNGTFVNGERLSGRRLLDDGDVVRVGDTEIGFRSRGSVLATTLGPRTLAAPRLSEAQRRVLVALCRPYGSGAAYATPAANREIADELVLSVEAVKTHLRALFHRFGIEDLPQNRKRTRLVELALETGAVSLRELER